MCWVLMVLNHTNGLIVTKPSIKVAILIDIWIVTLVTSHIIAPNVTRHSLKKVILKHICIVMLLLPCESSYVIPGRRLMLKLKIYINWRYISGKSHIVWHPCDSSHVYEVHYFEWKLYHTGYTEIVLHQCESSYDLKDYLFEINLYHTQYTDVILVCHH